MSAAEVYQEVYRLLASHIPAQVDQTSLHRLTRLVAGMIGAKSASPARVAAALHTLGLSGASAESMERQIRRTENDPELTACLCFHPLARQRLLCARPQHLVLILDPTLQEDRVVLVSLAVWYRGRALPLAWAVWPANTPLEGAGFWERMGQLLDEVAPLLPAGVPVTLLADRAFGTPTFTDLVTRHGWHYVIRAQGQTHYRDRAGREGSLQSLVQPGKRAKLRGEVFKKQGWREASVVVHWGARYPAPLCLVSDLPADWCLLALYRRRYPIEASFRDYKSYGWGWEQGQVSELAHLERLLVGMALATWIAVLVGTQVAAELLARPASGKRRTRPWAAKRSLFQLGLLRLRSWLAGEPLFLLPRLLLDWEAPNWEDQLTWQHARAFVFA